MPFIVECVPGLAFALVVLADLACHVGGISMQALRRVRIGAAAVWAAYYAVICLRAGGRHDLAIALLAAVLAAIGAVLTGHAARRELARVE